MALTMEISGSVFTILSELIEDPEDQSDTSSESESEVSDEFEEEKEYDFVYSAKVKRVSIENYFEEVGPKYCDSEFKKQFRISPITFSRLANRFANSKEFTSVSGNYNSISAEKQMTLFLWFARHEACSFRDLEDRFNVCLWPVQYIIKRVTMFFSNLSM